MSAESIAGRGGAASAARTAEKAIAIRRGRHGHAAVPAETCRRPVRPERQDGRVTGVAPRRPLERRAVPENGWMVEVGSGRSTLGDLARASLEVRGPLWARRLADAATGLAVLSLAAGLWWGPVAVALVALVLLGVVAVRLADLPGPVQATGLVALLASAWAALLEGYQTIGWLDVVAHAVITGLLAAVATALLTGPPLRPARTAPGS